MSQEFLFKNRNFFRMFLLSTFQPIMDLLYNSFVRDLVNFWRGLLDIKHPDQIPSIKNKNSRTSKNHGVEKNISMTSNYQTPSSPISKQRLLRSPITVLFSLSRPNAVFLIVFRDLLANNWECFKRIYANNFLSKNR